MNTREELNNFLTRSNDFIQSSYILADIKIVNLLKSIASSKTILAIFGNCIHNFDYCLAKKKYLVKSAYLAEDKGVFVMPSTTREFLAFVFYVLMDIDGKKISLAEFISKYFYEDGSFSAGFSSFIKNMIVPFRDSVKELTESVISGELQNPVEALKEEEERREKERAEQLRKNIEEQEISKKKCADSIKEIKTLLLTDKINIKASKLSEEKKQEILLVIDTLANAILSQDSDAINYAFVAYKYVVYKYPIKFFKRVKNIAKLIESLTKNV